MRNFKKHFLFAGLVAIPFIFACKTREEPRPQAKFSLSHEVISEGDTVLFLNSTTNGSVFEWTIEPGGKVIKEKEFSHIFTDAGPYTISLLTKNGAGHSSSTSMNIEVIPDSIYRLSANAKKTWIVRSINYSGTEILTEPCQKDDEFTVLHYGKDTCTLTQGNDTCPSGTYFIKLPATSDWRFNSTRHAFEFALVAFGSPYNFSFEVQYLTKDSFHGFDAANSTSIKLARKP